MTDDSESERRSGVESDATSERWVDPETESICVAVVEAVGEVRGLPPGQLPTLADFVDPVALENLFRVWPEAAAGDGEGERTGLVQFLYDGDRVTVWSHGRVTVDRGELG
jgi:hypothetical protein